MGRTRWWQNGLDSAPVHSGQAAVLGFAVFPQGHGFNKEVTQFKDVGKGAGFVPLNDKELYWFFTCPEGENMAQDPQLIQKEVNEKRSSTLEPKVRNPDQFIAKSSIRSSGTRIASKFNSVFSKLTAIEKRELGGASIVVHLEDETTIKSKVLTGCAGVHLVAANWLGLSAPVHSGGLAVFQQGHGFSTK
ncbi:hypothetical protein GH714_021039 [Hevea brasiliensis]|uniref:Uncharacterized protein n=1 Tax=Hevea brasiliensis TaxID=3981 RepID=A0A6A6KA70_HEVBR|nr:hypothetical protein GH714_021039 [Hevea brasiliensis]